MSAVGVSVGHGRNGSSRLQTIVVVAVTAVAIGADGSSAARAATTA